MNEVSADKVNSDTKALVIKTIAPTRKKYEMCKNFKEKGVCKYGDKCLFAHGEHELTRRQTQVPE
jgi:hypothetical protein